jgi:hypothetical protein
MENRHCVFVWEGGRGDFGRFDIKIIALEGLPVGKTTNCEVRHTMNHPLRNSSQGFCRILTGKIFHITILNSNNFIFTALKHLMRQVSFKTQFGRKKVPKPGPALTFLMKFCVHTKMRVD